MIQNVDWARQLSTVDQWWALVEDATPELIEVTLPMLGIGDGALKFFTAAVKERRHANAYAVLDLATDRLEFNARTKYPRQQDLRDLQDSYEELFDITAVLQPHDARQCATSH